MEVILLTEVENLGKKYDTADVKSGYARNYLFPNNLATIATKQLKDKIEKEQALMAEKREKQAEEAKVIAQKLKNITLTIHRKVTSKGKLYGAISEKVLSDELQKEHSITVAEDTITIKEPIKELGEYRIEVVLSDDVTGHFKVVVKEEA